MRSNGGDHEEEDEEGSADKFLQQNYLSKEKFFPQRTLLLENLNTDTHRLLNNSLSNE